MTTDRELFDQAVKARGRAYARYSGFKVGAAILDVQGRVFTSGNVENAAYPLGACAETGAISAMVAGGGSKIDTIAIVGGREALEKCPPCGGCRQRIAEFASAKTRILLFEPTGEVCAYSVSDLLPHSFVLKDAAG